MIYRTLTLVAETTFTSGNLTGREKIQTATISSMPFTWCFVSHKISTFVPNAPFLYPLKASENLAVNLMLCVDFAENYTSKMP